ncbi:MAG: hypothetical protein WAP47_17785 [Candidatus Rokuibacteriota bacterium]
MGMINILEPIDEQIVELTDPLYWAEITIPGTLTKSYKNLLHDFDYSIATKSGAPILIDGELKISGGGNEFPLPFDPILFDYDDVWSDITVAFTTPSDWTTTSIEIYFKLSTPDLYPCTISLKDFKIRVLLPTKTDHLPLMGVH